MSEPYERYYLHTSRGRIPLDGSFRPSVIAPTGTTPNLVRARGYPQVYDLSDGLPDPVPLVLTGTVEADSEAELGRKLAQLNIDVRAAPAFDRDGRAAISLLGGSMIAVPIDDDSTYAGVTLTLILAEVPDPTSTQLW